MAEGTTALDLALTTEGDADGTELIVFAEGIALAGLGDDSPPGGLGTDAIGAAISAATGPLQYIGNHEEIAARKLAPPFWGKPFIAALLAAFMREIQRLEDDLWLMLEIRTLPFADLPRLKVLGKLVGQPRLGFAIERYRVMIQARALANVSRGRPSDIFAVLELLLGPGQYVVLEPGDATLVIVALQPITDLRELEAILPDVRAAGVGLLLLSTTEPTDGILGFYDVLGSPTIPGNFLFGDGTSPVDGTPLIGVTVL